MKIRALVYGILLIGLLIVPAHGYPGEDYTKILVLHLNFSHDQINEQSVEMQYGHPPDLGIESGNILGSLKTIDGTIIREFSLSDPRVQLGDAIVENNGTNVSITGSAYYSDSADFTLVMPYYQNQMTLDLTDKNTGRLLKSVNFSQAIERFRRVYPDDPGGTPVYQFPVEGSTLYLVAGIGLSVLLLITILMMARRK
jgi:hypothetical protein